jgi:hypothetical protein
MSGEATCLLALLCGGIGPAIALASRGIKVARFIGLQLVTALLVPVTLLFAQLGRSYELIVPLALVPLSYAGAMVFVRLLGTGRSSDAS